MFFLFNDTLSTSQYIVKKISKGKIIWKNLSSHTENSINIYLND
jgi:hypothetical protein